MADGPPLPARRRSSSPTPRARSPCASRTASRPRRPRSSSRPSTSRATTRATKQAELHAYVKEVVARRHAGRAARQRDRLPHQPDRQLRDRRPRRRRRASPAARSSSTPMAARPRTAAAPSRARTRPRSTARPLMPRATSPRTSSPRASPSAAPSSSPMRSASREPLSLYVDTHGTGTVDDDASRAGDRPDRQARRPDPARHPHPPRPQQADLSADRRLRPFRPQARGRPLPVGATRPGRGSEGRASGMEALPVEA